LAEDLWERVTYMHSPTRKGTAAIATLWRQDLRTLLQS
jgi:hypothetical protein